MAKDTRSARAILAQNLAALMARDGLSQNALARRNRMNQKTISNILNQAKSPQLDKIEEIASAFHLEPWQLLLPDLPTNLAEGGKMNRLISAYLTCDQPARDIVNHIAEREAEYKTSNS